MKSPLIITNTILLQAPLSKVWDALTNPEQTKKYMFGCETVSDWKTGSPLLWRGNFGGQEMVAVKGIITRIEAPRFLAYTVIDPNSGMEDVPENYLTVTYDLSEEKGPDGKESTLLTVTQGDYALVADGENRYNHSYNGGTGWDPILVQIKQLVESE